MKRVYENKFEKLYRRYYFVTLRITFKLCRSILVSRWSLVNQENDLSQYRNDFPHRICQYEIKF